LPSYEELAELVAAQASRIAGLEAEVAELRRRLGMNSTNSSKPPSADGLDKPKPGRGRTQGSGRRQGKQPGAPGTTRRLVDNPDQRLEHRPDWCGNPACGAALADAPDYARQRRQVFELPPVKPYVTEHQVVSVRCGCCGTVTGRQHRRV
jgi:transposase